MWCEETSPTPSEVREIVLNTPRITWPSYLSIDKKIEYVDAAMKKREYKFGSWRGFYTFSMADIVQDVNKDLELTNQYVRGEASGCWCVKWPRKKNWVLM